MRFSLFVFLNLAMSFAQASEYEAANCQVKFNTSGKPVLVKINGSATSGCIGTFGVEQGKVSGSKFEVQLKDLDTGIGLRNKHLKENYLKVKDNPVARLKLLEASNAEAQLMGKYGKSSPFKGELELAGKTKAVAGEYKIEDKKLSANFKIELTDFGVERPSFMGVSIVEKVSVAISFDLKGKK